MYHWIKTEITEVSKKCKTKKPTFKHTVLTCLALYKSYGSRFSGKNKFCRNMNIQKKKRRYKWKKN